MTLYVGHFFCPNFCGISANDDFQKYLLIFNVHRLGSSKSHRYGHSMTPYVGQFLVQTYVAYLQIIIYKIFAYIKCP